MKRLKTELTDACLDSNVIYPYFVALVSSSSMTRPSSEAEGVMFTLLPKITGSRQIVPTFARLLFIG